MAEVLTELFTGLIVEGSLGKNIRYYFLRFFDENITKEMLSNEVSKKQQILNGIIGLLFLLAFCFIVFIIIYLIFGNH